MKYFFAFFLIFVVISSIYGITEFDKNNVERYNEETEKEFLNLTIDGIEYEQEIPSTYEELKTLTKGLVDMLNKIEEQKQEVIQNFNRERSEYRESLIYYRTLLVEQYAIVSDLKIKNEEIRKKIKETQKPTLPIQFFGSPLVKISYTNILETPQQSNILGGLGFRVGTIFIDNLRLSLDNLILLRKNPINDIDFGFSFDLIFTYDLFF